MESLDNQDQVILFILNFILKNEKNKVHLSQIGLELNKSIPNFKKLLNGQKLVEFVTQHMSKFVSITTNPDDNITKYITIPDINAIPSAYKVYLSESQTDKGIIPSYLRSIWFTFSRPLAESKVRILQFGEKTLFEDYDSIPDPLNKNSFVVDRSYINTFRDDYLTHNNITRWAKENQINISSLIYNENISNRPDHNSKITQSIFEKMIECLSDDDLKRITMPLDIAKKLMQK